MTKMTPAAKAAQTRKAKREQIDLVGLCVRTGSSYRAATRDEILDAAAQFFVADVRGTTLAAPASAVDPIRKLCAGGQHETFVALFCDTRHRVIAAERMFRGTIDGAAVYPREVVKRALELNAAAVVLGHNHPSGDAEPSEADRSITVRISKALALVDVRLLDHIVVGKTVHVSLAERGWL